MSKRPVPTTVVHFTDICHLETIIGRGLVCDTQARAGLMTREAGHPEIKEGRRNRPVDIAPFGVVADYVPFYFAPRSPMMSAISFGKVPDYGTDVTGLIYLVTTTQAFTSAGLTVLVSDRNARLGYAEFKPEAECDDIVDWGLMQQKYWFNTQEYPERRERRMAECLVPRVVPFDIFHEIVVHGEQQAAIVTERLAAASKATEVHVRPHWYI